jgi:hypothetical protein
VLAPSRPLCILAYTSTNIYIPVNMAKPSRRPTGRPALPPGEAKRHTLCFRATTADRDVLAKAAEAAVRPLSEEIGARVARTLEDDLHKSETEIGIDRIFTEIKPLVVGLLSRLEGLPTEPPAPIVWLRAAATTISDLAQVFADARRRVQEEEPTSAAPHGDLAEDQHHDIDRETGGQSRPAMYAEVGGPGELGRLLPVEISVTLGDDGTVVLVRRHGGQIIGETPIDPGEAKRLAEELLAACGQEPSAAEPPRRHPKRRRS